MALLWIFVTWRSQRWGSSMPADRAGQNRPFHVPPQPVQVSHGAPVIDPDDVLFDAEQRRGHEGADRAACVGLSAAYPYKAIHYTDQVIRIWSCISYAAGRFAAWEGEHRESDRLDERDGTRARKSISA